MARLSDDLIYIYIYIIFTVKSLGDSFFNNILIL